MLSEQELKTFDKILSSKKSRLNNLYFIVDKDSKVQHFKLNSFQQQLLNEEHQLLLVLKARQLGITTFYCIDALDECLFNSNVNSVLIADDLDNAKSLLEKKIKFAYNHLPEEIKAIRTIEVDNREQIVFNNGSSISVSTSARSGTVQYLHISEFGKICRKFPDKAQEIISGSLNAVNKGQKIIIESTADGTEGHFYNLCQKSLTKKKLNHNVSEMDFVITFFPWYENPDYCLKEEVIIDDETNKYFEELEENHNITLTKEQKRWYFKKKEQDYTSIRQEFPSTPEEAFEKSIIGAYFTKELETARKTNRITSTSYDKTLPVCTAWDIGVNDQTAIWFFQKKGFDFLLIDYVEDKDRALPYYLEILSKKGYFYNRHFLPHDIVQRSWHDGRDGLEAARSLGYEFTKIEKPKLKQFSINEARLIFNRCFFDNQACQLGLKRLSNYRKEWNDRLGCFNDKPRHDINSNGADAFQTFALATKTNLIGLKNSLSATQNKIYNLQKQSMDWLL